MEKKRVYQNQRKSFSDTIMVVAGTLYWMYQEESLDERRQKNRRQ